MGMFVEFSKTEFQAEGCANIGQFKQSTPT